MIEEAQAVLPIWILLSAVLGFLVGETCGEQLCHRKYLEQANADLRDQLQNTQPCAPTLQSALDQQRRVINDIHKRVIAVSKGLEKPTS
jgi:hypothetical protein